MKNLARVTKNLQFTFFTIYILNDSLWKVYPQYFTNDTHEKTKTNTRYIFLKENINRRINFLHFLES
jgi:hypothetical protein